MKNFKLYSMITIVTIFILFGGYFLISQNNQPTAKPAKTNEVVFYYGSTCPHCKNVEDFLNKNKNIETKISIVKKEVYENKNNAQDMQVKADICGVDSSQGIPVPFLYFKGECIIGDTPIIQYLTDKTK